MGSPLDYMGAFTAPVSSAVNMAYQANRDSINDRWRAIDFAESRYRYENDMRRFDEWTKEQRDREDNAVTRRVADMVNAGINPLLAAGNPASATPVAPQNSPSSHSSPVLSNAKLDTQVNVAESLARIELLRAQAEAASAAANKDNVEADTIPLRQTTEEKRVGAIVDQAATDRQRAGEEKSYNKRWFQLQDALKTNEMTRFFNSHGLEVSRFVNDKYFMELGAMIQSAYLSIAEKEESRKYRLYLYDLIDKKHKVEVVNKLTDAIMTSQNQHLKSQIEAINHKMKLDSQENTREWIKLFVNSIATVSDIAAEWVPHPGGKTMPKSGQRAIQRNR